MLADDDTDSTEYYAERAAIMEFDGGLPRHQAEFYAVVATCNYCRRRGLTPPLSEHFRMVMRYLRGDEGREPSERPPF